MDNKDYIVRASLANDSVRAFAIISWLKQENVIGHCP